MLVCFAANGTLLLRCGEQSVWLCGKCGECIHEGNLGENGKEECISRKGKWK